MREGRRRKWNRERMKKKRHGEAQQFLLRGLVRCGECGRLMVRDKKRFRCRYQKFTDHRNVESIPAEELEGIVWKAVDIQLRLLEEKEAVLWVPKGIKSPQEE